MNAFRALAWIASAPLKSRSQRRTASIINALSEEVQKDIGWKWTANRRASTVKSSLDWDLL
jgi:hypothetical protein